MTRANAAVSARIWCSCRIILPSSAYHASRRVVLALLLLPEPRRLVARGVVVRLRALLGEHCAVRALLLQLQHLKRQRQPPHRLLLHSLPLLPPTPPHAAAAATG